MNSKILSLLPFTVLVFFSACGDEKEKGAEEDTIKAETAEMTAFLVSNHPSKKCMPSYEQWLQLGKEDGLAESEIKLNCKGVKRSERVDVYKKLTTRYDWGGQTPVVVINYGGEGKLKDKTYFPLDSKASSCFPTKEAINSIQRGQSLADVEKVLGCAGQWEKSFTSSDDIISIYNWVKLTSKKYLSLEFSNGMYSNIAQHEDASCIPTYTAWQSVRVGSFSRETKMSVLEKLGCDDGIREYNDHFWGKTDRSTDYVEVLVLENDAAEAPVPYKEFKPKWGTKSNCIPVFTDELWNKLIVNPLPGWNDNGGSFIWEADEIMGCKGIHVSHYSVPYDLDGDGRGDSPALKDISALDYTWTNVHTDGFGASYELHFDNDYYEHASGENNYILSTKIYHNKAYSFSSCSPTQQRFDKINVGEIFNTHSFRCNGTLAEMRNDGQSDYITYAWGDAENAQKTTKNYATVKLDQNNKIVEKYIYFRP